MRRSAEARPAGIGGPLDPEAKTVIQHDHDDHQRDEDRLAPGVEDQAEDEQRRLAESVSRYARKTAARNKTER